MSETAISKEDRGKRAGWALRGTQESGSALLLLIYLCERSDENGECWPGEATISDETRMSLRTIHAAIKTLRDHGWLSVRRQKSRLRTNIYRVDLLKLRRAAGKAALERRRKRLEAETTPTVAENPCVKPVEPPPTPVEDAKKPLKTLWKDTGNAASDDVVRVQTLRFKCADSAIQERRSCPQFSQELPEKLPENSKIRSPLGLRDFSKAKQSAKSQTTGTLARAPT